MRTGRACALRREPGPEAGAEGSPPPPDTWEEHTETRRLAQGPQACTIKIV